MHDCPGNQRNLESQDGNGSYHDNNTVAIRHDRSRGIRWLLIAESVRQGMSIRHGPTASTLRHGPPPMNWAIATNGFHDFMITDVRVRGCIG